METDEWIWNQDHGYMVWNLYAASGGHLKGRKIISCEAMTNTRGVFKTSLEEIKRHDDMNFITGINHTILHGYNYSPVEAGFPGWIRFGAYFSEQNTWWPYFRKWTDYNARLSYIFQNSKPVKQIAILGPTGDVWSEKGLIRNPFHREPWYCYRLWESLSQSGTSCDYIDEKIIVDAVKGHGLLQYGQMSYRAIILCGVRSVEPETASAIREFVAGGGKLVIVDGTPQRSLALPNANTDDDKIRNIFSEIFRKYTDRVIPVAGPANPAELLTWTSGLLGKIDIEPDVVISNPDKNVFQIRKSAGKKDIWFFVNSNMAKRVNAEVLFPTGNKIPWKWDPENGSREPYPFSVKPSVLNIELDPLESLLLIFEPGKARDHETKTDKEPADTLLVITGPWEVEFQHTNGSSFTRRLDKLVEFGTSPDNQINSFAGTVNYLTRFESDGKGTWLSLNRLNKGVAEVYINGKSAGVCWYGKPVFKISSLLKEGLNTLEIRYITILSNYVRTLKDNPTAVRWTDGYIPVVLGLDGKVVIYK